MQYRAYIVGSDGHLSGFEPLVCTSDDEAIGAAKRLLNLGEVELWDGARLVARLNSNQPVVLATSLDGRDLDAEATAALEAARLMPAGPEKFEALKRLAFCAVKPMPTASRS
jgi:hypothetical protein